MLQPTIQPSLNITMNILEMATVLITAEYLVAGYGIHWRLFLELGEGFDHNIQTQGLVEVDWQMGRRRRYAVVKETNRGLVTFTTFIFLSLQRM